MDITKKVFANIKRHALVSRGETVVVGVSGGPDSAALLNILAALRYELGVQIHVAHFNHSLRKGALTDQRFVERIAKELHCPCHTGQWKPPASARGSLEERARDRRIKFFLQTARQAKASAVALAHTRDDLAETVLMRVLRGTGLQGLRAILPKREIAGCRFIRPMLSVFRAEIEAYLRRRHLKFRTDPTNRQTKFFRNKIRLRLIPLLRKEYNANIQEVLASLAENMAVDYQHLDAQASPLFDSLVCSQGSEKGIQYTLEAFLAQPQAMRRMLLRRAVEEIKGDMNRLTLRHIEEIEDMIQHRPEGAVAALPCGIRVHRSRDRLTLRAGSA